MLIYVDTSVLARAYLADEDGHEEAIDLLGGDNQLFTASITLVELTSVLVRAAQLAPEFNLDDTLAAMHADLSAEGAVAPVRPNPTDTESAARAIARNFAVRAQEAMHLAVADIALRPLAENGDDLGFATRDEQQRSAAIALGFVAI